MATQHDDEVVKLPYEHKGFLAGKLFAGFMVTIALMSSLFVVLTTLQVYRRQDYSSLALHANFLVMAASVAWLTHALCIQSGILTVSSTVLILSNLGFLGVILTVYRKNKNTKGVVS